MWSDHLVRIPLLMMAVIGTLAFNFQVLLPRPGRFTFDGGAAAYTALAVAMAVGSVAGALATGARGRVSERLLVGAALGFGVFALLAAVAPTLPVALVALVPLGFATVTFAAGVNSTLQLEAAPAMRARYGALLRRLPRLHPEFGGPIVGALSEMGRPCAPGWCWRRARRRSPRPSAGRSPSPVRAILNSAPSKRCASAARRP